MDYRPLTTFLRGPGYQPIPTGLLPQGGGQEASYQAAATSSGGDAGGRDRYDGLYPGLTTFPGTLAFPGARWP